MRQDVFERKLEQLRKRYTKQIAKLHDGAELRTERIEGLLQEYQDDVLATCKKAY